MPYTKEKRCQYMKEWRLKNFKKNRECSNRWSNENPEYRKKWVREHLEYYADRRRKMKLTGARRATKKVYKAVKSGKLISLTTNYIKCSLCDKRARIYDHRDYSKPLDVTPVCHSCNQILGPATPLKSERG